MGQRGRLLGLVCLLFLVAGAGCAERIPLPLTAAQLRQRWGGPALVAYLGQPDASPVVCDLPWPSLGGGGGVAISISEDVRESMVDALVEGRIAPALWRGCIDRMVVSASWQSADQLLDRIVAAYGEALSDRGVEGDPMLQARVEAMEAVYLNRPANRWAHPDAIAALANDLRRALAKGRLGSPGSWAAGHANGWLDAVDIDRGWLRGRQVDRVVLDQLFAAGDQTLLLRISQRLPEPQLRAEARRRVIRLHIQASADPQVRAQAAAVEETVMRLGVNPISTVAHPPLRARLDLPIRQVRVRQQVLEGTATLLGSAERRPGVSVLPELPLRGGLQVDLDGLDRPVTLCAPPAAFDPAPCLTPDQVAIDSPLVTLASDGVLHFVEHAPASQVVGLGRDAEQVVLPVSVAGQHLVDLKWALVFETPADLVLKGANSGPDLLVRVERGRAGRVVETVREGGRDYLAVVEAPDAYRFRISSRGDDGSTGSPGSDGSDGFNGVSGSSASCPSWSGQDGTSGSDGSSGGNGGTGGDGGKGGDIQVEIACGNATCADLVTLVNSTISSVGGGGGSGGSGGRGGHGGRGGSGGSGDSCSTADGFSSLSGGHGGADGHDGLSGSSGFSGSNGAAGHVRMRVVN